MKKTLQNWLECVRAFSIPITFMSWAIVFTYGIKVGGNIWLGLLAGLGIQLAYLSTNLIDDYLDYKIIAADKTLSLTVQKGKCRLIFENEISLDEIKLAK